MIHAALLPDYSALVFDEAHEIEDVATQYFGVEVSSYRMEELARCRHHGPDEEVRHRGARSYSGTAGGNQQSILCAVRRGGPARRVHRAGSISRGQRGEVYSDLLASLELVGSTLRLIQHPPKEIIPLFRRTNELLTGLKFILEEDDERFVYWVERRGRGTFLQATPMEVSGHRFGKTLQQSGHRGADVRDAGGGGRVRLHAKAAGTDESAQPDCAGPLRLPEAGAVVGPQRLPEPKSPAFTSAAARRCRRLRRTAGGGHWCSTSYQQMRIVYEKVSLGFLWNIPP